MDKKDKRICLLCGGEVKKIKGMSQDAYRYELEKGAHIKCLREQKAIMQKYHISGDDYLRAVVNGLFELLPELSDTKALKQYNSQIKKMKEEMDEKFPYLNEVKAKKREDAKEEAVEKEEKEFDIDEEDFDNDNARCPECGGNVAPAWIKEYRLPGEEKLRTELKELYDKRDRLGEECNRKKNELGR